MRIICFSLALTVFISGHFLYSYYDSEIVTKTRTEDHLVSSLRTNKYVTKSLSELGTMDQFNKYCLFLNAVPKSGSEILIMLLQKLQGINNFKHVRMRDGNKTYLTVLQQVIFFLWRSIYILQTNNYSIFYCIKAMKLEFASINIQGVFSPQRVIR